MSKTAKKHKSEAPSSLGFAVIVCSSSRYESLRKGEEVKDLSGDLIVKFILQHGYDVIQRKIVPDDIVLLKRTINEALANEKINAIITCGGTGISPTDKTIEVIQSLIEKELSGFGELFRMISYQEIGSSAILTRAIAGIIKRKAIFSIPGSPQAISTSLKKLILPEVNHIIRHVTSD